MPLPQRRPTPPEAAPLRPPPARSQLALGSLLSPTALAALGPAAAGVPAQLWRRSLLAPVEAILSRPGKGFRARLTELAFRLGGGRGQPPPALGALLEVIHAGSMIIDDIEDGSPERRGAPAVHCLHGMPLALNAGNWMYFAPLSLLPALGLPPQAELRLHRRITRVLLDCHFGQALDLGAQLRETTAAELPDVVATVSLLKTGRLVGLAAELGAVAAGADDARVAAIVAFGEALGVALQMLDDLGNLAPAASEKRHEDLRHGRVTWVWAWAAQLDPARFAALVEERERLAAEALIRPGLHTGWERLARRLRTLVDQAGRQQAHLGLDEALDCLRGHVGDHPLLKAIAHEIERLEVSYG
jgi:geranylgeranyl pyrophosphate synthase